MATVEERIAVVEALNTKQSEDIKEILSEIKNVTAFIYDIGPRVKAMEKECLPTRLTKVETRQKVYTGVALAVAGLAASKEWLGKVIFG